MLLTQIIDPIALPQPMTSASALARSASCRRFAKAAGIIAVLLGLLVLAGWAFDLPILKSVAPGFATMKPMTASSFVLAGLALWLLHSEHAESMRSCGQFCGIAVVALSAVVLGEYLFGWDMGLDLPLFRAEVTAEATVTGMSYPGRMAPASALMCLALGSALVLSRYRARADIAQYFGVAVAMLALLALSGYLFGTESLYRFGPYPSVAAHTSAGHLLLALGVLCAHPDQGPMRIVTDDGAGSIMARRLLPVVVVIPLVVGWFRLQGEIAGLYTTGFGLALFAVSNIVVFAAVILWTASHLNRMDAERRRADKAVYELGEQNRRVREASRMKSEFQATMSHELRTPLNAIIGFTGTLLMKLAGPLTRDQDKQLRTVQTSARHLLALINDLLDLAKIEAGRMELSLIPTDCGEVINEAATSLRPRAEAKGLEFTVTVPPELTANTDRHALSQIVINLGNNAINFTERGSVRISSKRGKKNGGSPTLQIRVEDTGIGIRAEDQAKLFEAFTRAGAPRSQEGTGLGLHVSQKLARALGGRIEFESEYGRGSTFTLVLSEE